MTDKEFIKVANQLRATDSSEVVKVAGILNKLKNLFKQITNPYYRQAVQNIRLEGGALSDAAENLKKHLDKLTQALNDGDVYEYKSAKIALDNALNEFVYTKNNLKERADKLMELGMKEIQQPGTVDKVTEEYAKRFPNQDVNDFVGKTIKEAEPFANINNIFINNGEGRTAGRIFLEHVATALASLYGMENRKDRDKYIKENFDTDRQMELLKSFSNAILDGIIVEVKELEPVKREDEKVSVQGPGWVMLEVATSLFVVPGIGATVKANVLLLDKRGDVTNPEGSVSLRKTKSVDLVSAPTEFTDPEPAVSPAEEEGSESSPKPEPEVKQEAPAEEEVKETVEEAAEEVVEKQVEKSVEKQVEELSKNPSVVVKEPERPKKYRRIAPPFGLGDLAIEQEKENPDSLKDTLGPRNPTLKEIQNDLNKRLKKKKSSIEEIYVDIVKNAQQVPYLVTKLSDVEFAEIMKEGYKLAFGKEPSAEALAGGWAQAVLESGVPIKLPNNNVGNIKAFSSQDPYFVKKTVEFTKDGKRYIEEGTKWRAFKSPAEGAKAYWELLGRKYGRALDWMAAGDPSSASVALGLKGYYTAPIKSYARGVSHHYNYFMKNIAPKIGIKSNRAEEPGAKPILKKWRKEYSDEEKEAILKQNLKEELNKDQIDEVPEELGSEQVEDLITKLIASPLTNMVKEALLKSNLPHSNSVVILTSINASVIDKMEFARIAASIMENHLDIDARVCGNNNDIEISCSGVGSEMTMTGAIQELCDMVAVQMKKKSNVMIWPTAVVGGISKFAEIKPDTLIKNCKTFTMRMVVNG